MSVFPWQVLITGATGVLGAIGGAGVTGWLGLSREKYRIIGEAAVVENKYRDKIAAELVVVARLALRNFRQTRVAYGLGERNVNDELRAEIIAVLERGEVIAEDINRACVTVEIHGSAEARVKTQAIYAGAAAIGKVFQERNEALRAKKLLQQLPPFDEDAANAALAELADAITSFIDVARLEASDR